jgi:hypothetical protein
VDVNEITCFFQWWEKHEVIFPIVGFFDWEILRITGSQIETERIFSLVGILTNLKNGMYS